MSASVTSFAPCDVADYVFDRVRVYSASTTSKWLAESPTIPRAAIRVALRRPSRQTRRNAHAARAQPRRQAFDDAARDRLAELVGVAVAHGASRRSPR